MLPKCDGLELLSIVVSNVSYKVCISLFYRPPSSSSLILDSLFTYIESLNVHQYSNYILLGDFNVNFCSHETSSLFCKLKSLSHLFSLQQIVTEPTHVHHNGSVSLIDLIFVSNNVLSNFCHVIPPLANSDHKGVHMQCNWRLTSRRNCTNNSKGRVVWCYNQADWGKSDDIN